MELKISKDAGATEQLGFCNLIEESELKVSMLSGFCDSHYDTTEKRKMRATSFQVREALVAPVGTRAVFLSS